MGVDCGNHDRRRASEEDLTELSYIRSLKLLATLCTFLKCVTRIDLGIAPRSLV
jgi:hypothetical protein